MNDEVKRAKRKLYNADKLASVGYRNSWAKAMVGVGLGVQIATLMQQRGWTQRELARKTGMTQQAISRLSQCGDVYPTARTLLRLARAFDCGAFIRFVPFDELHRLNAKYHPAVYRVPPHEKGTAS